MKRWYNFFRNWEQWPAHIFYLPLVPFWLLYCLRSRNVWFFTASKPTLTFGGFEGEGKGEMYRQLPPNTFPRTIYIEPSLPSSGLLAEIAAAAFGWPVAVKPDVGMKGLLFRKITTPEQLKHFHRQCPTTYIIQEWIDYPVEVGVFYCRMPNEAKGEITGFTLKEPVMVTGDGVSTVGALIERHPRTLKRIAYLKIQHEKYWSEVLADGAVFQVTFTGNRTGGGRLYNLKNQIDDQLTAIFDDISAYNQSFFWGRYDIKCADVNDLKNRKNYSILEFNGAGAGPNHIYHCGLTLSEAYREVLKHWNLLYRISRYNHQCQGARYWSFMEGWRFLRQAKKHFKLLYQMDKQIQ